MNYIELKRIELARVRREICEKQEQKCMICERIFDNVRVRACVDHQHRRRKTEEIGSNVAAGLVRGCLCIHCNLIEGKFWNSCRRYGWKPLEMERLAHNLYKYYAMQPSTNYIHPSEIVQKIVSKRQYNKLCTQCKKANEKPPPEYKKKQKLNKVLKRLFQKHNVDPYGNVQPNVQPNKER